MRSKKDLIIWDNVERLLLKNKWTLAYLAKKMGISPQALNSIKNSGIGIRSLRKLSKAFSVTEDELLKLPIPITHNKPIPVISWVHAGLFADPVDQWPAGVSGIADPVTSFASTSDHAFALVVEGDSMMPRYLPGDIVIIDPAVRCDNGSACVIWINGEVSLKLFWEREGDILLKPMNDKYPEVVIKKDSKVDFKVVGKVVDMRVKL